MAIGNPVDVGGLNAKLGDSVVSMRGAMDLAREISLYSSKLGKAGLMAAGLSDADATSFLQYTGYLGTLSGVYFGSAAQTPAFNFDDAFALARGINP